MQFERFGGQHAEVGAIHRVLGQSGARCSATGEPWSEPMLFGLGGGIGIAYFVFQFRGSYPIHLGTRRHSRETTRPEYLLLILERAGVAAEVQNSSSARAAATNLRKLIEERRTPILLTDVTRLPYTAMDGPATGYHAVVAYAIDEETGRVWLSDRAPTPFAVGMEELSRARATSWSPKFRAVIAGQQEREVNAAEVAREGIRDCVAQMTGAIGVQNFGLHALDKWADLLTSTREKKAWSRVFPPGQAMYRTLSSLYYQIELRGSGGSAFRPMYAAFLREAAPLLNLPALHDTAARYDEAARRWTELARTLLPDAVPQFREARELMTRRRELFETQGEPAIPEMIEIQQRLRRIDEEAGQAFPLGPGEVRDAILAIRESVLRVREAESGAVEDLRAIVG